MVVRSPDRPPFPLLPASHFRAVEDSLVSPARMAERPPMQHKFPSSRRQHVITAGSPRLLARINCPHPHLLSCLPFLFGYSTSRRGCWRGIGTRAKSAGRGIPFRGPNLRVLRISISVCKNPDATQKCIFNKAAVPSWATGGRAWIVDVAGLPGRFTAR